MDDSFQDCDINAMSTRSTNRSADDFLMGPSTDLPAIAETTHKICHIIYHTILDQISEAIVDTRIMKAAKTDRTSTEATTETEGTNKTTSMTRGMGSKTGMTITRTETGSTTGDDQTNTNTTKTKSTGNLRIYKSKLSGTGTNSKKFHHIHESTPIK